MADLVKTLTSHLKLVAVGVGAVALFGGTATTISLADSSTPTGKPSTKPAPHANPHATTKAKTADTEDADEKDDQGDQDEASGGVRPTDTHGYCVSHAVAAAKAAGKTGQDIAAAAHSCKKDKAHGKSASAPGHNK